MSLLDKVKGFLQKRSESNAEPTDNFDDWETRDKSLKALRRQRRRQIDEMERKQLTKAISSYNQDRDKSYFRDKSIIKSGGKLKKFKGSSDKLFVDDFGFMKKKKKKKGFF